MSGTPVPSGPQYDEPDPEGEDRRAPAPTIFDLVEPPSRPDRKGLRLRWTLAFVIGELVGFIAPAVFGATLGAAAVSDIVMILGLTFAGAFEGAALGLAEAWVLRRYAPEIDGRDWVIATAVAASFAWFVGMAGAAVIGSHMEPVWIFALMLVPAWLAALLGMGFAQWLVMRRSIPGSRHWIIVNAAAWLVGVMIPMVALIAVPDGWPMNARIPVAVVAAVVMGAVVGVITGYALDRILARLEVRPVLETLKTLGR